MDVKQASSSAIKKPKIVTSRAASLSRGCIVITGVLSGIRLDVMTKPATKLPQANRLIGLITAVLFSLIGEKALNRGWCIDTK